MRKLRVVGVAIALCLAVSAQRGNEQQFRWDWRRAIELDIKHTVSNSRGLSDAERRKLSQAIRQQLKRVMEPGADAVALAAKTRVMLIDLDNDGMQEAIAQPVGLDAGCGATGNCPFWAFKKHSTDYDLILGTKGIWVFTVSETATSGFRDLVLASHDSASERTLFIFRYSDGHYLQRECYNAEWDDRAYRRLAEPRIAPCVHR